MKLSEIAAIIESVLIDTTFDLVDIHTNQHGVRAKIAKWLDGNGIAEATLTVSALDMEQANYPSDLIQTLTKDATEKLRRFLAGEADAAA